VKPEEEGVKHDIRRTRTIGVNHDNEESSPKEFYALFHCSEIKHSKRKNNKRAHQNKGMRQSKRSTWRSESKQQK